MGESHDALSFPDGAHASDGRTIAAIATAAGRGAIALIRISGPDALRIGAAVLDPFPGVARQAVFSHAVDGHGEHVDDVVAVAYHAPRSFTGEDMVEISTHGGAIAPLAVLAAAFQAGASAAQPGEFTRRAVLNGKVDLLQAEAIGDLIDARSSAAHRVALHQLDGGLTRRIELLRADLLALEAMLAYDIDFPEEDDGPVPRERIDAAAMQILSALKDLLATGARAKLVHEGALVVLAGAPNAGKSSLFNALLGETRAIVTEIPGTTRDAIEAVLDVPGWPLRLVDTAGLRETGERVEQLGIETTTRYMQGAALVLHCVDARDESNGVNELEGVSSDRQLLVRTKADLVIHRSLNAPGVFASAESGEGLGALLREITRKLSESQGVPDLEAPLLTRARHVAAVRVAEMEVSEFLGAWQAQSLPSIVAATHVRQAVDALSDLIGVVLVDDVLEVVFRNFCVGK